MRLILFLCSFFIYIRIAGQDILLALRDTFPNEVHWAPDKLMIKAVQKRSAQKFIKIQSIQLRGSDLIVDYEVKAFISRKERNLKYAIDVVGINNNGELFFPQFFESNGTNIFFFHKGYQNRTFVWRNIVTNPSMIPGTLGLNFSLEIYGKLPIEYYPPLHGLRDSTSNIVLFSSMAGLASVATGVGFLLNADRLYNRSYLGRVRIEGLNSENAIEYLDSANKRRSTGKALAYTGGGLLGLGIIYFLKKDIDYKRWRRISNRYRQQNESNSIVNEWQYDPNRLQFRYSLERGLNFIYHF